MAIREPLQEINRDCAMDLASYYIDTKENRMIYTCLLNTTKIEEKGGNIKFYKPVEDVKEFNIFCVFATFEHSLEVRIFSLNPLNETIQNCIYRIVYYTQFLPVNKPNFIIVFRDCLEDIGAIVKIAIDDRGFNNIMVELQYIHIMDKTTREDIRIDVPDEVTLEPLKEEDAEVIGNKGKYVFPPTADYFRELIRITGGYGIFSKNNKELLTWGLKTVMGCIDFLGSIDEDTSLKYKNIVIKKLATELAYSNQMEVVLLNGINTETKIGFVKAELSFLTIYCTPAIKEDGDTQPSKKTKSSQDVEKEPQPRKDFARLKYLKEDFKKLKELGKKILVTSTTLRNAALQAGERIFTPIDKLFTYSSSKNSPCLRLMDRIRNLEDSEKLFQTVGEVAKKQENESDHDNSPSPITDSTTIDSTDSSNSMLASILPRPPLDSFGSADLSSFDSLRSDRAVMNTDPIAIPGPSQAAMSRLNLGLSQSAPEKNSDSSSKKNIKGKRKERN